VHVIIQLWDGGRAIYHHPLAFSEAAPEETVFVAGVGSRLGGQTKLEEVVGGETEVPF